MASVAAQGWPQAVCPHGGQEEQERAQGRCLLAVVPPDPEVLTCSSGM